MLVDIRSYWNSTLDFILCYSYSYKILGVKKNINVNWTWWITNWRILKNKSILHPSIHPSILPSWCNDGCCLYLAKKTLVFVNTPPSFLQKNWKFFMQGKRMVWMANSYVDGKFSSLPSKIYYGCMVNLPCSMDLWGFCAWVHPYHGGFTMDGPMHTASQVLTTKLMYGWAQTYEAPCMMGGA